MKTQIGKNSTPSEFAAICLQIRDTQDAELDLSGSQFTQAQIKRLFEELSRNPKITHLTLHHCQLAPSYLGQEDAGEELAKQLKTNSTLLALDIRNNGFFTEEAAKAFFEAFKENRTLKKFWMGESGENAMSMESYVLDYILQGLARNTTLEVFHAEHCSLDERVNALSVVLSHNKHLRQLDLPQLTLNSVDADALSSAVSNISKSILSNTTLQKITGIAEMVYQDITPHEPAESSDVRGAYGVMHQRDAELANFKSETNKYTATLTAAMESFAKSREQKEIHHEEKHPTAHALGSLSIFSHPAVENKVQPKPAIKIKKSDLTSAYSKLLQLDKLSKKEVMQVIADWLLIAGQYEIDKGRVGTGWIAKITGATDEKSAKKRNTIADEFNRLLATVPATLDKPDYLADINQFISELDKSLTTLKGFAGATVVKELANLKQTLEVRFGHGVAKQGMGPSNPI